MQRSTWCGPIELFGVLLRAVYEEVAMRLTALVLAAGLLWPIPVLSETTTHDTVALVLGKDLFGFCSDRSANSQSFCNGYLAGVADALSVVNTLGVKTACLQLNIANEKVKDIVVQYLTAHPEKRDLAAAGQGLMALQAAFPCH
jgi:Rap1a immunity proteins